MRHIRFSLIALVLVAFASPMFAICISCDWDGYCRNNGISTFKCKPTPDGCRDSITPCPAFSPEPLESEWQIASVEITQDGATTVRTAEAVTVADAGLNQQQTAAK